MFENRTTHDATVGIDGSITPDDRGSRAQALWKVVGTGGDGAPAKGSLLTGSTDVTLTPSTGYDFTVTLGFDLNQNGQLDASEVRRTVNVHLIYVENIAVAVDTPVVNNALGFNFYMQLKVTGFNIDHAYITQLGPVC